MIQSRAPRQEPGKTICDILERRAAESAPQLAYAYLENRLQQVSELTYGQMRSWVMAIAEHLSRVTRPQEPVACILEPGLGFVAGFFACLWSGRIAVPIAAPRPRETLSAIKSILDDCGATRCLSSAATVATMQRAAGADRGLAGLCFDDIEQLPRAPSEIFPNAARPSDIALLQYTSGSTGEPKGVIVGHDQLIANCRQITRAFGNDGSAVGVCWLPPQHDMGLISGIVHPMFLGARSYLMSPAEMIRSPSTWLEAISRFRGTDSGGPNFAFDLCVKRIPEERRGQFKLDQWSLAFCGAEPVRLETLDRFANAFGVAGFRRSAFTPCYGLAEATVLVSSAGRGELAKETNIAGRGRYVTCGPPSGQEIAILDTETLEMTPEGTPGEIWISGPNIARGYWGNRRANRETFVTRNGRRWLRTGDLGFLHGGEIHICGRIKSILIVRGMKHSFEDIERTVAATHAAFTGYPTAAFSPRSAMGDGEGLVVWQETSAKLRGTNDEELARALIRSALIREHGINPAEIELLAPGAVPRTRSGKIMRQRCCEIFEQTRARSYTACIDNHT